MRKKEPDFRANDQLGYLAMALIIIAIGLVLKRLGFMDLKSRKLGFRL